MVHILILGTPCAAVGLLVLTGMLLLLSSAPVQQVDKINLACLELATVVWDWTRIQKIASSTWTYVSLVLSLSLWMSIIIVGHDSRTLSVAGIPAFLWSDYKNELPYCCWKMCHKYCVLRNINSAFLLYNIYQLQSITLEPVIWLRNNS